MGTVGRRMGKVRAERWGSSGVCPQTRAGQLSSHLQNGSQGDFSTGGRAEPWKPKRIRLQRGLWPLEAARVNYNRGQGQERAGVAQGTCRPQSLPRPGARFSSRALAQLAGRRSGTGSPPGPSGRVQTAKFLRQGRTSGRARAASAAWSGHHLPPPAAAR